MQLGYVQIGKFYFQLQDLWCVLFLHTNLRAIQDLLEEFKLSDRNIQKVFSQSSEYNEIVDG